MTTVTFRLTIRYRGQEIVEETTHGTQDTLGQILEAALERHKLPTGTGLWEVRHRGQILRLGNRLTTLLMNLPPGTSLALEIWQVVPDTLLEPKASPRSGPESGPPLDESDSDFEASEFDLGSGEDDSGIVLFSDSDDVLACEMPSPMPSRQRSAGAGKAKRQQVENHATVRFYNRMNPQRMYPLLVILSEKSIREVVQKQVQQAHSKSFQVELGTRVEIVPILPGCDCYPPSAEVIVGRGEATASFYVVAHILGTVQEAHVAVRQDGEELATIPLQIRLVNQGLTVVMGLATFLLPFASLLLRHFRLDFESQFEEGFDLYARIVQLLLGSLSPGVLTVLLLAATGITFLWLRPRRRDLFFDITPVSPERRFQEGQQAIEAGDVAKGERIICGLLDTHPGFAPAWLLRADRLFDAKDYEEAAAHYEKALALGAAELRTFIRAAAAAGQIGQLKRALAILEEATTRHSGSPKLGVVWYNRGCYHTRLRQHEEAMRCLLKAVRAGYTKASNYQKDPDLNPLRSRADFRQLLARLDRS